VQHLKYGVAAALVEQDVGMTVMEVFQVLQVVTQPKL
jgi:hypothetical protein